jgi:hypothetical protein
MQPYALNCPRASGQGTQKKIVLSIKFWIIFLFLFLFFIQKLHMVLHDVIFNETPWI